MQLTSLLHFLNPPQGDAAEGPPPSPAAPAAAKAAAFAQLLAQAQALPTLASPPRPMDAAPVDAAAGPLHPARSEASPASPGEAPPLPDLPEDGLLLAGRALHLMLSADPSSTSLLATDSTTAATLIHDALQAAGAARPVRPAFMAKQTAPASSAATESALGDPTAEAAFTALASLLREALTLLAQHQSHTEGAAPTEGTVPEAGSPSAREASSEQSPVPTLAPATPRAPGPGVAFPMQAQAESVPPGAAQHPSPAPPFERQPPAHPELSDIENPILENLAEDKPLPRPVVAEAQPVSTPADAPESQPLSEGAASAPEGTKPARNAPVPAMPEQPLDQATKAPVPGAKPDRTTETQATSPVPRPEQPAASPPLSLASESSRVEERPHREAPAAQRQPAPSVPLPTSAETVRAPQQAAPLPSLPARAADAQTPAHGEAQQPAAPASEPAGQDEAGLTFKPMPGGAHRASGTPAGFESSRPQPEQVTEARSFTAPPESRPSAPPSAPDLLTKTEPPHEGGQQSSADQHRREQHGNQQARPTAARTPRRTSPADAAAQTTLTPEPTSSAAEGMVQEASALATTSRPEEAPTDSHRISDLEHPDARSTNGTEWAGREMEPTRNPAASRTPAALFRNPVNAAWLRTLLDHQARVFSTEGGWKVLEVKLDDQNGTVTIRARQEEERMAVSVGFSDPALRALAEHQSHRLQEVLQTEYGQTVDFSLSKDESEHANPQDPARQEPGRREPPAEGASETQEDRALLRRRAPGARQEWIG